MRHPQQNPTIARLRNRPECLWVASVFRGRLRHNGFFSFILSFSAVILLSGLPPVTATAARPPASPTPRCANTWLTDPITFYISLSLARCTGTSLSPEDRGKMATVLLVGKKWQALLKTYTNDQVLFTQTQWLQRQPPHPQQNQDFPKST